MRHRVVIVGAGFSGVALAAHLTRRRDAPAVSIIERDGRFGPGLAYSTVDPSHLLNVRASRMSAFADQPEHFIDWLRARGRLAEADPFAPRAVYRAYIEHVFHRARRSKLFGAVRRVRDEAVSCAPVGGAWRIGFASGRRMDADSVVLAIGHPPPQPPDAVTRGGVPVIGAWDRRAQKRISPHANVLIVGTGLSMVDVALSLRGGGGTGVLYAVSRRGLTPRAHVAAHAAPDALHLPDQLSAALHEFRAEIRRMAERGEPWQSAFDRIRRDTPALWRRLSPDAQRRFLRHLRPWWDVHRHRASPEVSARVDAMRATGVLRVIAGEIESVAQAPHGAVVTYRPRGARSRETLTVAHVIDCTGADNRLAQMRSPLVRQLTADGLARAHPTGLGFDVGEDGGLLGADGQPLKGLFALGPIVQGAFWETTAVPEIRARAAALADLLCLR